MSLRKNEASIGRREKKMTPSAQTSSVSASVTGFVAEAGREPLFTINPNSSTIWLDLKDAWGHRELLFFLVWRDLKVRYRQTLLGVAWVILQPLLMALVFTIFLSKLGHFRSDNVPYPIFAYAGLLPWIFFSNSVATGSSSLLSNSYIITKVYFPRLLIPAAIVGVRLVDFLIASAVLIVLMFGYGLGVGPRMFMLPLVIAELTLLSLAVSSWFSVLNIKYRDVGTLLPVLIQVWMFASPIIYPSSMVPKQWQSLYSLNPMVGVVEAFRASLFGLPFNWNALIVSLAITLVLLGYLMWVFCRWQDHLVDKL
jgi:lipopolysaccharide transport system permease protein